jgi:hypothetical protein
MSCRGAAGRACSVSVRESKQNNGRRPSATIGLLPGQVRDRQHTRCPASGTPDNFTIFAGTSEIQHIGELAQVRDYQLCQNHTT